MRRRRRAGPGTGKAFFYAVMVHVAALAVFAVSLRFASQPPQPAGDKVIQAVAVPEPAPPPPPPEPERERSEQQRRAEEAARAEAERRQQIELQRKQEEERQRLEAERRRIEAEKKRREEEERRRREEQKRLAEERARKEKEEAERRQRQAEEGLRAKLEAEERERVEAERRARALSEAERYKVLIRQKVERNWHKPAQSRSGLECVVRVRLTPGGEVLQATVVRGSGDAVFDRSVENAVYKAVPLPVPDRPELFEYFRELEFRFRPEG
jgi:colicin import membrane protein